MDCEFAAPVEVERLGQTVLSQEIETAISLPYQSDLARSALSVETYPIEAFEVFAQASQLEAKAKVALIRRLIAHLEPEQIQTIVESGLQEISERHRQGTASAVPSANTRLVLKKDYTYQDRGLSQPTQYYVYLRRCKPKLDRYIGTLFYIPQGCTLSYFLDAVGRIMFNPPYNIFQLRDYNNLTDLQVVRLICLEPPPQDYTFTKQQKDTPAIYLHLEYLDPHTYQPIVQKSYPFPSCMHEGGQLDRYRWEVSTVTFVPELSASRQESELPEASLTANLAAARSDTATEFELVTVSSTQPSEIPVRPALNADDSVAAKPARRVLELPAKLLTCYLADRSESDVVLKRIRLWVSWSEKAMPQSKWAIVQDADEYTLLNAHSQRWIFKFSPNQASITLGNSLPVLVKWFHDLGLAVSQTQNQRRYSVAQVKLARSLFVDMSLPQKEPLTVLKKLFGVTFTKP